MAGNTPPRCGLVADGQARALKGLRRHQSERVQHRFAPLKRRAGWLARLRIARRQHRRLRCEIERWRERVAPSNGFY